MVITNNIRLLMIIQGILFAAMSALAVPNITLEKDQIIFATNDDIKNGITIKGSNGG